jgi:hypothetical protein
MLHPTGKVEILWDVFIGENGGQYKVGQYGTLSAEERKIAEETGGKPWCKSEV